jgi:hypothetical protein
MTDKELLELAAKAAGIKIIGSFPNDGGPVWTDQPGGWWGPLTGDGDALRLAAQLGLEISFVDNDDPNGEQTTVIVGYPESEIRPCRVKYVQEFHNRDIFAATRLAIVRAAAEVGRAMP